MAAINRGRLGSRRERRHEDEADEAEEEDETAQSRRRRRRRRNNESAQRRRGMRRRESPAILSGRGSLGRRDARKYTGCAITTAGRRSGGLTKGPIGSRITREDARE